MIIVSWDVGVKNLAYCVLMYKYNEHTKKADIEILDWDVINLIDDTFIELPCCGTLKCKKGETAQKCNKKATYILSTPSNSNMYGFCKPHLTQSSNYWSDAQTTKLFNQTTSNSNNICQYNKKDNSLCGRKSKYCYKNGNGNDTNTNDKIYYCSAHYKSELNKKIKEYSPTRIHNMIVQKYPTAQLQLNLINKLDKLVKHFAKLGVQQIIIENQPSHKNPKMKSISNTLFDYFMIRGYIDKIHGLNINLVRFMCPSNKLKVNNDNTLQVFKSNANNDERQKYKLTKQLGIQYTKQLLSNNEEELEYLDIFRQKQDDLCDAYLQGRYYLEFILNKPDIKKKPPPVDTQDKQIETNTKTNTNTKTKTKTNINTNINTNIIIAKNKLLSNQKSKPKKKPNIINL